MTRSRAFSIVAVCLIASTLRAQTTSPSLETDLGKSLNGKILTLRIPSASNKLHFDTNGMPLGKQEHGIASLDRDILVRSITVTDSAVKIEGQRVYYSWDAPSSKLLANLQEIKVAVDIDHPKGAPSETLIAPVLTKVFLSSQESEQQRCSPAETEASHAFMTEWLYKISAVPTLPAASKSEPHSVCFPTSTRGYLVGEGVIPPKPVSTPDPEYSQSARKNRIQGTAIYAVLINEKGLVTDVLLVRSLEPSLNYNGAVTLRKWRFRPATLLGKPVSAAVHVEINFRLY